MMSTKVTYRTARLALEGLDEGDSGRVLDFVQRNREFLTPWEPSRAEHYYTMEQQARLLREEDAGMAAGLLFKLWISKLDEPEGRLIGSVSLSNIVRGCFHSCHLGYKMDQDELNRGYMTEALRKVIQIAFEELKLHRIEANVMPRNQASLQVVEKLGFVPEGLAKQYLKINGKWEDHIHMTLINHAWEDENNIK
ncbi:ribosomal-protein-alanine N-acetyltransferase [Paenibacillus sp. UNCCL117]|uniref:GNAT family N-acetyltransferase n=1 Tax=unclassified Paenibacillus TaxID=185978 RepID=UPI0008909B00|nr:MULTISPECIES: GNAT family N-acetyltransferase [unclassified Paenibacillus]SDC90898.1 ribosomal-protein-alanine N-acetyltransferase [Paenibacillus sp. cl123]SFW28960.1 ribosomal-protein-alanine N-acetyltransferase [Paenibacillus sp. UNCCL117]